jgi:serine/threonine protein phosphatase PrpC
MITTCTKMNNRYYQEDRFFVKEGKDLLLGVFDGHGGEWVADYACQHTPYVFRALQRKGSSDILKDVIHRLHYKTEYMHSGATASIVWVNPEKTIANVAILGDSPVIIKNAEGDVWISPEHNVRSNEIEAQAAITRYGGMIRDGYLMDPNRPWEGGLQMSRSLGDKIFRNLLNPEPEIFQVPISENSWILCGTDGILDAGHENTLKMANSMADLIEDQQTTAETIVDAAITAGSYDNATAILVRM